MVRWSEGSIHPEALTDGNVHTGWTAPSENSWAVLDLHSHYEVSELDMVAVNLPDATSGLGPDQSPMVRLELRHCV